MTNDDYLKEALSIVRGEKASTPREYALITAAFGLSADLLNALVKLEDAVAFLSGQLAENSPMISNGLRVHAAFARDVLHRAGAKTIAEEHQAVAE